MSSRIQNTSFLGSLSPLQRAGVGILLVGVAALITAIALLILKDQGPFWEFEGGGVASGIVGMSFLRLERKKPKVKMLTQQDKRVVTKNQTEEDKLAANAKKLSREELKQQVLDRLNVINNLINSCASSLEKLKPPPWKVRINNHLEILQPADPLFIELKNCLFQMEIRMLKDSRMHDLGGETLEEMLNNCQQDHLKDLLQHSENEHVKKFQNDAIDEYNKNEFQMFEYVQEITQLNDRKSKLLDINEKFKLEIKPEEFF